MRMVKGSFAKCIYREQALNARKGRRENLTAVKGISGVYWDRGGRPVNEDSLTLQQVMTARGRVWTMAVSDGIGGLSQGEIASGYILEKLVENFYAQMVSLVARGKGQKPLEKSLLRCFYSMNGELRRYASGKGISLGATVSLLFVWERRYLVFHLGDSRIYLCRRGKRKLLTGDHSDGGHGIFRCMGSFPFQYPDIRCGRIYGKCGFLLCTDGFYRTLDGEDLGILSPGEVESGEQAEKRLRALGALARKRGEQDNLSAVYAIV